MTAHPDLPVDLALVLSLGGGAYAEVPGYRAGVRPATPGYYWVMVSDLARRKTIGFTLAVPAEAILCALTVLAWFPRPAAAEWEPWAVGPAPAFPLADLPGVWV